MFHPEDVGAEKLITPGVCIVSSAFFGSCVAVLGCVFLTMGFTQIGCTLHCPPQRRFACHFAELLVLMYRVLGIFPGHISEVERILTWSGCQDGDTVLLVRLPNSLTARCI